MSLQISYTRRSNVDQTVIDPRPSYNTGVGFFTLGPRIYDANGVEFKIKGTNTCHYDEAWAWETINAGIPNAKFNVNRIFMPLWSAISESTITGIMDLMVAQSVVPMPTVAFLDSGYTTSTTCSESQANLNTAVSQWVSRSDLFKPYERWMLLNIANEWGPGTSSWRDSYIAAVASLRAAGYLCPIVVDAGGCGQSYQCIPTYGQAIYDADPQKNIIFSQHIYGVYGEPALGIPLGSPDWHEIALSTQLDSLQASGLPVMLGEFGPGRNIGPSPTELTPATVIQYANARGIGWLSWAWDDGVGDGWFGLTNAKAFSLTNGAPTNGAYPNNTDLSIHGNECILNPSHGSFFSASPATIFV
jgi:mannan endo-1,4-beta-mannosidase